MCVKLEMLIEHTDH